MRYCDLVCAVRESLPTNAHCERSFVPVSPSHDGHFALSVRPGAVEYLMRMSMIRSIDIVGVGVGTNPIVRVLCGHRCLFMEQAHVFLRREAKNLK